MSANKPYTDLDYRQATTQAFDEARDAMRVIGVGGNLVPQDYDEIDLTYVVAGNGVGQVKTATYYKATVAVATLTLTYDAANNLTKVVRS
jgi:hypothetical protein